ncbi:MAG: hypothetical protein CSA81_02655 [Acidobacteria bacterium]|nr:MAG: hypothetical protein CSA81_02655 [Acidobacteriota bacterium]PIE91400.1 MAG: hypothetical protein CR997_01020 [Acidobacteriota bacterium]
MDTEGLVDISQIKDISEGDMDFERDIIEMYLMDTEERIQTIESLAASQNWDDLKREAHTLKGSSGNIGVKKTFSLCKNLESACTEHDTGRVNQLISEIRHTAAGVKDYFTNYLG